MMRARLTVVGASLLLASCAELSDREAEIEREASVGSIAVGLTEQAACEPDGQLLFEQEVFEGNGRTCITCHTARTGTLSPKQVEQQHRHDPANPLFRPLDSNDGVGSDYSLLLRDATFRVEIPLPLGWSLVDHPEAQAVVFRRGAPSTLNTPSLDDVLMWDGRAATLEDQALGAITGHAQATRQPTQAELSAIAEHEQSDAFFSSPALRRYARGGAAPVLPNGKTASELRGRKWFEPTAAGICNRCHGGPMLDQTTEFLPLPKPPGTRFISAFVSELNKAGNPVRSFQVDNGDGTTTVVSSPDPGRALFTGDRRDVNAFKIPTLWGAKHTAPYFHDNSAKTLEQMVQHYADYFRILGIAMSDQDKADIVAFMKLL